MSEMLQGGEQGKENKVETPADRSTAEKTDGSETQIREVAKAESLAYFEEQGKNLDAWLDSKAGTDTLAALLDLSKDGARSLEDLRQRLALPPEMEKWLPTMILAVEQCRPISDIVNAAEYIRKIMREKADPSAQLADAMGKYDAGTSWYHATDEGGKILERIGREVEVKDN